MNARKNRLKNLFGSNTFVLIVVTIVIVILFWAINHNFLNLKIFQGIMTTMSFDGFLVLAAAIVLLSGNVDLSTGAVACMGGMIFGMTANAGVPWGISFVLGILVGMGCGLLHAFLINELKFMSFLATLAMAQIYRGFCSMAYQNKNVQITNPGIRIFSTKIGFIPLVFIIMVALLIIYGIFLRTRKTGRAIYLVGGNREAARLAGVSPRGISYFVYINSAAICALAGILQTARMHTGSPDFGNGSETAAITAACLGGISFMGGSGTVGGCFVGVLLLDVFDSGLTAIRFPSYWQIVVRGALLLLALAIDYFRTRATLKKAGLA